MLHPPPQLPVELGFLFCSCIVIIIQSDWIGPFFQPTWKISHKYTLLLSRCCIGAQCSSAIDSAELHEYVSEIIPTLLNQAFLPWRFGPHTDTHTEGLVCVHLLSLSLSKCSIFVIITLPWGFNSHSAQRKLNYAAFYPLCVVKVQSEGCEKLGSVPEKCSKLWYWILYCAVLLFRDILSGCICVLQCYNCVWL